MPATLTDLVNVRSQLVEEMLAYLDTLAARLMVLLSDSLIPWQVSAAGHPCFVDVHTYVRLPGGAPPWEWAWLREQRRQAVILGPPWTGKTTLLQVEGYRRARETTGMLRACQSGLQTVELPIFIPLQALAEEAGELEEAVVAFLKRHYKRVVRRDGSERREAFSPRFWTFIQEQLRAGRCRLLLDDLHKVAPGEKRQELWKRLGRFAVTSPHCPFVLTSRMAEYKEWGCLSFAGTEVSAWELVALRPEQVETLFTQGFATRPEIVQLLVEEWDRNPHLRSLVQVPLVATHLRKALWDRQLQLPVPVEKLYPQCISALWEVWQRERRWPRRFPEDTMQKLLEHLALRFFTLGDLPKAALHAAIREFLGTTQQPLDRSHEDILQELSDAGILVQHEGSDDVTYHFPHPLIQTYLATCAWIRSPDRQETVQPSVMTPEAVTGHCSETRLDAGEVEGFVFDSNRYQELVVEAQKPGMDTRIIDHLVPLVGSGLQRHRDPTERYWIYIALGVIGAQAISAVDREKARTAVQQGLTDDNEFARGGAIAAWQALG